MGQVGLPAVETVAAVAQTTSADATYRYRLLADGTVAVDKRTPEGGWEQSYTASVGGCSCPGYEYRQDCKHTDVARGLRQWWAERSAAQ